VWFQNRTNGYDVSLYATATDSLYPAEETVSFWDQSRFSHALREHVAATGLEAGISSNDVRIAWYVRKHLASWLIYHFHDTSVNAPLRATAQVNDNRFLRPDGANLPAFLYLLKQQHPDSYEQIRRTVRLAAPFLDDFILEPQELNPETMRLEWRHVASDAFFDVSSLSDGTLRFIALATLLLQPRACRPSVILVDEPELGLHPAAITLLAALIKQAAAETQTIVSTQSPLLLDHFDPGDVLVADRVAGATQLSRLDPERLAAWLEDYSLGQLWEKNEIGGRPVPERARG
jgi:predicted ATPase